MSDWMRREAERIRQIDERRQQQGRLQLHRAEVLKTKAPIFLAEAATATQDAVDVFNTEIAGDRQDRRLKVEIKPNCIAIGGMGAYITATLENAGAGVIVCMSESGRTSATPCLSRENLSLDVDDQDNVSMRSDQDRGPELVAKVLLGPFLRHIESLS